MSTMRLVLKSDPRYLCLVRTMIRSFGHLAGFDEATTHRIALAVDEGCTNIIRHAYSGRLDGDIEVACCVERRAGGGSHLVVRLLDRGCPMVACDPTALDRKDPLVPGGLGIHLMRDLMDDVRFATGPDGCNLLELSVACPEQPGMADL